MIRHYLLVDDNEAFAENLAEILRDTGAEVDIALNGLQAIERVKVQRYDALVTCFPDEQHALGSLTVALLLGRRQRKVRWLGAALPLTDLERVCADTKPALVLLSVSRAALVDLHGPAPDQA